MTINLPKKVFIFGHRQCHGKDSCCDLLETILNNNNICWTRNSFANNLKRDSARKYMLDFSKMDSQEYKMSKPEHLNGRSVRDVLIHEGNSGREVWNHTWAWACYSEIFDTGATIGFVSDFRFPNEADSFKHITDMYIKNKFGEDSEVEIPKLVKVHVFMPEGIFNNDGADGELPDDFEYWDYNIINHKDSPQWKDYLSNELIKIMENENVI